MQTKVVLTLSAIATLTAAALVATAMDVPGKHGTDILHLFSDTVMTNSGVLSNASGNVAVRQNEQGNADNQELDIRAKGLDTNATYQLLAIVNDDTNATQVTNFTSDAKGRATLLYRQFGNGHGLGHGRIPLPSSLNPVSDVRQLTIANTSTQAVLSADLTMPNRFEYLIKRDISSNSIDASLRIHATTRQTQFRLLASGLNPTNDYLLVLNGGIVQTNSTDKKGRLAIRSLMENPGDILDLHSVALWDTASNVLVSTTLP
jgi:hypothetical protein